MYIIDRKDDLQSSDVLNTSIISRLGCQFLVTVFWGFIYIVTFFTCFLLQQIQAFWDVNGLSVLSKRPYLFTTYIHQYRRENPKYIVPISIRGKAKVIPLQARCGPEGW